MYFFSFCVCLLSSLSAFAPFLLSSLFFGCGFSRSISSLLNNEKLALPRFLLPFPDFRFLSSLKWKNSLAASPPFSSSPLNKIVSFAAPLLPSQFVTFFFLFPLLVLCFFGQGLPISFSASTYRARVRLARLFSLSGQAPCLSRLLLSWMKFNGSHNGGWFIPPKSFSPLIFTPLSPFYPHKRVSTRTEAFRPDRTN